MPVVLTRATQQAAGYRPVGGIERCAYCRFYGSANNCGRILGPVSPAGWCRFFSRMVWLRMDGGDDYFGTAGPPGATLNLSFLDGTLPSGVTFTRASTATYFDSTGTMRTAAANVARFDYNPSTRALNGLLIEEARTNSWQYSADISNAATSKSGSGSAPPTVTGNQSTAPDGTTTAARMVMPAVTATQMSVCAQGITVTANPYAFAVWMKGNTGGEVLYLMATPDGVTYYRTSCTLTTAWQRFQLVTSALTAGNWYFQIGCDRRDASQANTSALTCFVWGAQLEAGAFPTSYIPTTGTAVTRSADVAMMPTAAWYNAAQGSLVTQFLNEGIPASGVYNSGLFAFDDGAGTRTNSIDMYGYLNPTTFSQPNFSIIAASAVKGSISYANLNLAGRSYSSFGSTWNATTSTVSANGGVVQTAAVTGLPIGINRLTLGGGYGGLFALDGWLQRVRYWPRVLTNTELQQVTT